MSWQLAALNLLLRLHEKPYLARVTSVIAARERMERQAAVLPMPPGAMWRAAAVGGVPALRLEEGEGGRVLLWFHGGGYCLGSPRTHAAMVGALAVRAGVGAVLPEYRLAPEHPFPAAVEDAVAAWAGLRADGVPAGRILLGGDSAGGGLAFALLHLMLAAGEAPGGVVAFSPWVDLTLSGESFRTLARRDAILPAARMREVGEGYLVGADPRDPRASPLFGRFSGAPEALIQASRAEILLDDARAMAARLREDGVEVTLDLRPGVPHVWQIYQGGLPEADAALDRVAAFLASLKSV